MPTFTGFSSNGIPYARLALRVQRWSYSPAQKWKTSRQTAGHIPNAELCLIEGGGHAVAKTKLFEDRILKFLQ